MSYLYKIRPVLFLFYMVETVVNIVLVHYYLTAFVQFHEVHLTVTEDLWYIGFLACFYILTVLTLFASINVCTRNRPSILEEVLRPLMGCIVYTVLTLLALYDAETDFYVMYPRNVKENIMETEKALHPYFKYLRAQATASLVGSVIYLLHSLIALDVLLSNEDTDSEAEVASDNSNDHRDVEVDYEPVQLYVLGSHVQGWLERFQWFHDYINVGAHRM